MWGLGQFGEYLASQFGETAKSVNLANFSEGCQSGDSKNSQFGKIIKGAVKLSGDTTQQRLLLEDGGPKR